MSLSNVSASVRDRLLNRSRETGESHQALLTRYALERLLYRLSESDASDRFVLKGAYAFLAWQGNMHRPTKDVDLLGYGSPDVLEATFKAICRTEVEDDGVDFAPASISLEAIRDQDEYDGMRVHIPATIGSAQLRLQVDVGFGDAIVPEANRVDFPVLLDFPAPSLQSYPRETVVAEKLECMVKYGIANSRMKDFYDIEYLSRQFAFEGPTVVGAIRATFDRRQTNIPAEEPIALTDAFSTDSRRQKDWKAFCRRIGRNDVETNLNAVVQRLHAFLAPPLKAAGSTSLFRRHWPAGGPWAPLT